MGSKKDVAGLENTVVSLVLPGSRDNRWELFA
jgi:hypothetical protein